MNSQDFVNLFRRSAPYIHRHRGKTFVIFFPGEAVVRPDFADLMHDLALLNSLGIRLVLVAGARSQIDQCCSNASITPQFHQGRRVTDTPALACVRQAAGSVRAEVEALLSMGLANSPMAGASIRVTSGNFVKAQPLGVVDGVDFQHTGKVRKVDAEGIRQQLDNNAIVVLSLLGYSPSGETFNLLAEEVAAEAAIALQADKLILLTENNGIYNKKSQTLRQLRTSEAEQWLEQNSVGNAGQRSATEAAVHATGQSVARAHVVGLNETGGILRELFTHDGVGTLIAAQDFDVTRRATLADIGGIMSLIEPLEQQGVLVRRSREQLEIDIDSFHVIERDGLLIACAALYVFPEDGFAELACLAVHADYQGQQRGSQMLRYIEQQALTYATTLFVLTTQTAHWFKEHGFKEMPLDNLPMQRKVLINLQRNSKVFGKTLVPNLIA